jgi:ribosomal protein S18 acetylase RimI-like enzyme
MSERANGIVVRRADSNDADARLLAALGARLFEDAFGAMNDPEDLRLFLARTYSPDLQLAELRDANRATWIAEANHEAVGYAMARRGSASPRVVARHPAEVQRIYADRAWHGRDVGGALLKACVEQAGAWGCDVLWLGVWEQNPRGIAFYEKWGFRRVGEQRFLVGTDSQRDHVMSFGLA